MDECEGEVVVVDNDSDDGSLEKLLEGVRRMGDARVSVMPSGRNGGFGFGNNVAIRRALASSARPEYIHLFNPDSIPEPAAVRALVDAMDASPELAIVGSRLRGLDGAPHASAFHFPSVASELDTGLGLGVFSRLVEAWRPPLANLTASRRVDWVSGCSLMLRTSVLDRIGLFDEAFFLYFEEVDLCRRAHDAGYAVGYVHESVVAHVGGASTGIYDRAKPAPRYWFESRERYLRKHHGDAYFQAVTWMLASSWAASTLRYALQQKPPRHPPRFARDLVRGALGLR